MTRLSFSPRAPLLALGDISPAWPVLERPEMRRVEEWLADPGGPRALWLHGPSGSGRTTSAAAAIRSAALGTGLAAKRVAAHRGLALEEILDDIGSLLRQLGSGNLERVLGQRSVTRSKISVLFEALRETPFVLWMDDADALAPAAGQDPGALTYFLEGCAALEGGAGKVIITSTGAPPSGIALAIEALPFSVPEIRSLWDAAGGRGRPPGGVTRPLEIVLLAKASKFVEGTAGEAESEEGAPLIRRLVERAGARLGKDALTVLRAASSLPPSPSRQALRDVLASEGIATDLATQGEGSPLQELREWGLVEVPGEDAGEGPPIAVHEAVRAAVLEALRARDPDAWKRLRRAAARHALGVAARTGILWKLVSAWRHLVDAELYDDAYDVQRIFVQELIRRGHLDLAREVLEQTAATVTGLARAVALGNLAIIHKNTGDYDRALEIYGRVHREFASLGDEANTARVLHQIGNTRYLKGDHAGALESYRTSLEASTALGDRAVAGATRIQIANLLYQEGELKGALHAYEESLAEARSAGESGLTAAIEIQIGQIHFMESRYVEAEAHFREAETQASSAGDLRSLVKVYEAQSALARKQREYDAARSRCDKAVETAAALGDVLESVAGLVRTADLEWERLHLSEALATYRKAQSLLGTFAARGAGTEAELEAISGRIDGRLRSMEESLGTEAFARIARLPAEGHPGPGGGGA